MEEFCFVHCADLHLDSPFSGIGGVSSWLASRLREATFNAFSRVVDVAVENGAAAILIAGDVFDSEYGSLSAQLRFRHIVSRATEAGIAVFVACGNHDPRKDWMSKVRLPDGVHIFATEPETRRLVVNGEVVATITGVSFGRRAVRTNLVRKMRRPQDSPFAVAVLHCNVGGIREHDNYAPCTLEDLRSSRFDYYALGHIHKPQILSERDPCVVYSGTTQGRAVDETGERGCFLVRVRSGEVLLQFVPTSSVVWQKKSVAIDGLETVDDLLERLQDVFDDLRKDNGGVLLHLVLEGSGALNDMLRREEDREDILEQLREWEEGRDDFVWTARLDVKTRGLLDTDGLAQRQDFVGDFVRAAMRLKDDPQKVKDLLLEGLAQRELRQIVEQMGQDGLREVVEAALELGLSHLLSEG
ncbi:MAG: phosphoesterase [Planctomycetota bacterium]|nr:MAG: phosphoesterase [Planctomycetota bacterium]